MASAVLIDDLDKVRILYDREQSTARIVVRSKEDLDNPLVSTSRDRQEGLLTRPVEYDALVPSRHEPYPPQV